MRSQLSFPFPALALVVLWVPAARAQTSPAAFGGGGGVTIVSEWKGEDRGDGSGSYRLVTTVTDPASDVSFEHTLTATRDVRGEVASTEDLRVFQEGQERARASSDPAALGTWADAAVSWVLPFDLDLSGVPRRNYRPNDRLVRETVQSVVAEAKVSTRRASDGRTTAEVEIPGELPVDVLAERFLAVRQALREADIGVARLRIRGKATAPVGADASTEAPAGEPSGR